LKVTISHHVDEIRRDDGSLIERYEYDLLDFGFEDGFIRARAYSFEPDEVGILGHFSASGRPEMERLGLSPPSEVISDLRQRGFRTIKLLGPEGYTVVEGNGL
jgi:hypothetical protein